MAQKIDASIPADLVLGGSWRIEWAAVDPSTGADISGVKITSANVVGTDTSAEPAPPDEVLGPFRLVPGPDA